jgi:hypothetical protein
MPAPEITPSRLVVLVLVTPMVLLVPPSVTLPENSSGLLPASVTLLLL